MKRRAHADRRAAVRMRRSLAAKLALSHMVDENTVATDHDTFLRFVRVRGIAFEGATDDELNERHRQLCDVLLRQATPKLAMYLQMAREPVGGIEVHRFGDTWAGGFAARWAARLASPPMLYNEWVVTLEYRPQPSSAGRALSRLLDGRADVFTAEAREDFDERTRAVLLGLDGFGPRLMGAYADAQGLASEPLQWLHVLVSGYRTRISTSPTERISEVVSTVDAYAGLRGGIELTTPDASTFVQMLGFKQLPHLTDRDEETGDPYAFTEPGMLRALMDGPPVLVSHYWEPEDPYRARGKVVIEKGRKITGGDETVQTDELDDVAAALQGSSAVRGRHSFVVAVKAGEMRELERRVSDVAARLRRIGAVVDTHRGTALAAYLETIPGCASWRTSDVPVMHANVAAWTALHNYPTGQASGNHWGPAIMTLRGTGGAPVFLNFHIRDLGHTFFCGPSRKGKTTAMAAVLAHMEPFGARHIIFDYLRGFELPVRRMGGAYLLIRRGEPSNINPFALPDTGDNRLLVEQIIEWAATEGGRNPLSVRERAELTLGVAGVFSNSQKLRRLRRIVDYLDSDPHTGTLAQRLARWIGDGPLAWVLDNERDAFGELLDSGSLAPVATETSAFADDPVAGPPILMYLFHRTRQQLTGQRLVLWWDEVQRGARDDRMGAMIRDALETFRRLEAVVVLATQQPENLAGTVIGKHVASQTATQIYFRNPAADPDIYMGTYHLNAAEFDLVKHGLSETRREVLIKQDDQSMVAQMDFSGMDEDLAILSSREANVRLLDAVRAERGFDDWDEFHRRRVAREAAATVREKVKC